MPQDTDEEGQGVPAWRDRDRKRGVLTKSDRDLLAEGFRSGDDEAPSNQTIRDKRYRIRERLKNVYLDFNYLTNMKTEDRERVFQYLIDEGGPTLQSVFEELYLGIVPIGSTSEEVDPKPLADLLERAITEAERRELGHIAKVSVDIDIERTRPETEPLLDKLLESQGTLDEFLYYIDNDGDTAALLNSVVEQDEPIKVELDNKGSKAEVVGVDEAKRLLERETEVLDEDDTG